MTPLNLKLSEARTLVDKLFDDELKIPEGREKRVIEAMRYSAIGSGKAFRPFLVLTVAKMLNVAQEQAARVAVALEMVHTYSLIHDDLPAMDNDTLRRGKPTNHVQFDEATAILAGDALLTQAFEVLANEKTHPDATVRIKLIEALSKAAGTRGMIGGQMMDLLGEKEPLTLKEVERMQSMKTGALLEFACTAPAILIGASDEIMQALKAYAHAMGLMFQITDDILDVEGDSATVGKTLGKDSKAHKSTFVSLLGVEEARQLARDLGMEAKAALKIFDDTADMLNHTTSFILSRNK